MSDDFYLESLKYQNEQLEARIAEAQSQLRYAKANADYASGGEYGQQLADLQAQQRALYDLANRHVASQRPRAPEHFTAEERAAKPIHKMDWNDSVELTRQSKYAKNIRSDDPNMIAGWHEANRRRGRGE